MSQVWAYLSVTALMFTGLLLVFIILLQRGRGGGLAGAFGGAGGQSALGTKAGDVFTKITVGLAVFWVFLACVSIYTLRASTDISFDNADSANVTVSGDDSGAGGGDLLPGNDAATPPPDGNGNNAAGGTPGGPESESEQEEAADDEEPVAGP